MTTQPAAKGRGYLVALVGALAGDLLLGAVAATPYIYTGGGLGDLGVVALLGTYLPASSCTSRSGRGRRRGPGWRSGSASTRVPAGLRSTSPSSTASPSERRW